jgi:hypothetical protein
LAGAHIPGGNDKSVLGENYRKKFSVISAEGKREEKPNCKKFG